MNWTVIFSSKAAKQRRLLPDKVRALLDLLSKEMELNGPIRKNWRHFGRLTKTDYHCHLKKGRPTYVACWRVEDNEVKIIEVYYAGSHEKAPY